MYGHVALQGIYFKNLYSLLGAICCFMMVQFYRTDTDLGRLLQNSYECLTMELGLPDYPFKYNYKKYSGTTRDSWMKYL